MNLKICFVGGTRFSQPLGSTIEKKFRSLESLGDVFVIGSSSDLRFRKFVEHARFYLLPKLPVAALRYAEFSLGAPLLLLWLIFRYRVQVVVAQSPYEGASAAFVKKLAGCFGRRVVLVVESHGEFEESIFLQRRILLPGLYRFLMRRAARFSLRHADILRAVSDSTRQQLEQWAKGKPIFQFPTWTDIEPFLQAGGHQSNGVSQGILYAGLLIPRKGVHHLINAFGRLAPAFPNSRLVIVGHAENKNYAARVRRQAAELGLNGRVDFVGGLAQAELAMRMVQSCAFALPTYSEGLPRVLFEAMAAGLPVVASAVSGIPEIISERETGFLLDAGDEAGLAERLHWILEHPREAREIGSRARAFAERFFSTETYVNGYARVFEEARRKIREPRVRNQNERSK